MGVVEGESKGVLVFGGWRDGLGRKGRLDQWRVLKGNSGCG